MSIGASVKAVIFDLDGVIVSTDNYHYRAWKELADQYDIDFDRQVNERLRGVSRMDSLTILLEKAKRYYSDEEKFQMMEEKNNRYREMLAELTPNDILPGIPKLLLDLSVLGVKQAIGSSSKNAPYILRRIGMENHFDAVADGNNIKNSKPHPEVFLLAAGMLGIPPERCIVVEDSIAGIDAAIAAGMKSVAVGYACNYSKSDYAAKEPGSLEASRLIKLIERDAN